MRIQPIILAIGIVVSIWWATEAPMVREIQGLVMACDPNALFGDSCRRDPGAMALRLVIGAAVSLVVAVAGGAILKKNNEQPSA